MSMCIVLYVDTYLNLIDYVCVCVCVYVLVAQSCPTLQDPVDHSLPASSVHGIVQARILKWVASLSGSS